MGILRQGLFGGFEKKTGGLIGRKVYGKNIVSALPHKTLKARTPAQLDQQLKFELVMYVLSWFVDLIAIGFKDASHKRKPFDIAFQYNFKRLIVGTSPAYEIDYRQLVYSRGSLEGPLRPAINRIPDALELSWLPDTETRFNQSTDKASFVIYCPDREMIMKYRNSAVRAALTAVLSLPPNLDQVTLHVWMSFVSANGKMVSNSVYLGTI